LVVTKDATTNVFTAYVDGVQKISQDDFLNIAIFSEPNNIIHFLRDDGVGGENPSGFIDYIRIYDGVLTQEDVTFLFNGGNPLQQGVVSGTSIPIDTTALLVAGFNANSIWMIPAVLGIAGAGIAIFKLKRK